MIPSTVLLLASATLVLGHGRVTQPPSRASAWRLGFPTPANYDDDGLNCGGFSTQWSSNGGKCGICGDAYSIPPPRPHELGGTFGLGVIVAKYLPGATIATTTHLTASHMGYWEFKLCPDPTDNNQACFDKHLLVSEDGETKYTPKRGSGIYEVNYKLPSGLICEHCVLQWRYVAGNNWGICNNGTSGLGCGNQEEFRACSDIAIGVSKTLSDVGNVPSPLLFYLQNGYFELDQGYLIRKDTKRPTASRRPTKPKPSHRQPKISNQPSQNSLQPHPQLQTYHRQQSLPQPNRQLQPSHQQPQTSTQNQPAQQYRQPSQQTHPSHQQSTSIQNQPLFNQPSQQSHPSHQKPQTSKQNKPSQQYRQPPQQSQPSHQQIIQSAKPQSSNRQPHLSQQVSQKSQPSKQYPQKQQLPTYQSSNHQVSNHKSQPSHSKRPGPSNKQRQSPKRQKSQQTSGRYEHKTNGRRKTKKNKNKKKKKNGHRGNQKKRSQRYKYL